MGAGVRGVERGRCFAERNHHPHRLKPCYVISPQYVKLVEPHKSKQIKQRNHHPHRLIISSLHTCCLTGSNKLTNTKHKKLRKLTHTTCYTITVFL